VAPVVEFYGLKSSRVIHFVFLIKKMARNCQ